MTSAEATLSPSAFWPEHAPLTVHTAAIRTTNANVVGPLLTLATRLLNMTHFLFLPPQKAYRSKAQQIETHNESDAFNSFTRSGFVTCWLDACRRRYGERNSAH